MENYLVLKSVHLLGVTIFLGNIIVTAVWKMLADQTNSPPVVAYAQRLVTITDFSFTAFGVILILVSGIIMATDIGSMSDVFWLFWGWWVSIASGIIWVFILIPIQVKQSMLAKEFTSQNEIPEKYWRLSKYWAVFGIIATILPFVNLYFMIFKPT
jgi:uncharacterized membrane protein